MSENIDPADNLNSKKATGVVFRANETGVETHSYQDSYA